MTTNPTDDETFLPSFFTSALSASQGTHQSSWYSPSSSCRSSHDLATSWAGLTLAAALVGGAIWWKTATSANCRTESVDRPIRKQVPLLHTSTHPAPLGKPSSTYPLKPSNPTSDVSTPLSESTIAAVSISRPLQLAESTPTSVPESSFVHDTISRGSQRTAQTPRTVYVTASQRPYSTKCLISTATAVNENEDFLKDYFPLDKALHAATGTLSEICSAEEVERGPSDLDQVGEWACESLEGNSLGISAKYVRGEEFRTYSQQITEQVMEAK